MYQTGLECLTEDYITSLSTGSASSMHKPMMSPGSDSSSAGSAAIYAPPTSLHQDDSINLAQLSHSSLNGAVNGLFNGSIIGASNGEELEASGGAAALPQQEKGQQSPNNNPSPNSNNTPPGSASLPTPTLDPATKPPAPAVKSATARRRGHCKSRLGCFNCKRRRVKCNETRPGCSPCKRLGLKCEYPTAANISPRGAGDGADASSRQNSLLRPQGGPSPLHFEDLRFFHQFMKVAYPPLPLKGEAVWSEFAAMSYNYEHLAHALLGLGASHISQNGTTDYSSQALQHRVTAIKLVNEQLNCLPTSTVDADALLATIICLVSQSSLMPDSMMEYITMTRGANLVSTTIPHKENSLFGPLSTEDHYRLLKEMVTEQPKDLELIDGFYGSVMNLQPLCQTTYEMRYLNTILSSVNALRTSGCDAWQEFVTLFLMPAFFTNDEFHAFIAPDNYIGRLLIIHMFLFDYIAGRFSFDPSSPDTPKTSGRKYIIISWTQRVADLLPPEYQQYISWPLHFCDLLATYDPRHLLCP